MASLHFVYPEYLFLLVALPLLMLAHHLLFHFTRKKGMVFSNFDTLRRVTGKKVLTRNLGILVLRLITFSLIVVALAQPSVWYEGEEKTSDYVLAIDTSASMTATDVAPSRIEAAKRAAIRFIEDLNATAEVGVVGFSALVSVEQPLTRDVTAATQAVERLGVRTISGTDISGVLVTATNLLLSSDDGRVLILFTDGSTTAGGFDEDPLQKGVKYAKDRQVIVHTISIGSTGLAPSGYLPRLYNISAVANTDVLEYIAEQTGGSYIEARDDQQLSLAYEQLASESRSTLQTREIHMYLLLAAILLLFIEWGLTNTRFRLIP